MGEVGNTVAEDPPTQVKVNGEHNGNHVDEEEPMEVDDLKKSIKDAENEPEVPQETNGKSGGVMDVDEIESQNGDNTDPSQPEEVTVPDHEENSEDNTMDSEKDALAMPDKVDSNPVVLSDSSDEESGEDDENSSSSKFRSAEQSAVVSEAEGAVSNDKPVSIHSDSDEKEDDCIMIDDKKNSDESRRKKSPPQQMTDFDDDIEEIVEDPLEMDNPAKRIKLSGTTITSVDLSRPSSSSSAASSVYPVNLSTKSSSSSSQALNLTTKSSGNSLLNPFATGASSSSSSLPNLTDDMFVLEAPSFIVPYIYEKPPTTSLKSIVNGNWKNHHA